MKLETEVNMMLASEVPSAMCMSTPLSMPCRVKQNSSMGTMTMPPPTPKSPASTPAIRPTAR